MTIRRGFTLVESLLALAITAGIVVLTMGTGRQLTQPFQHDRLAWYQVVQVLERSGQFRFAAVEGDSLVIRDQAHHEDYLRVAVDSKLVLRLTNDRGQGYYPLLNHVVAVHWRPMKTKGLVVMRLKQEGLPWEQTILDLRGVMASSHFGR